MNTEAGSPSGLEQPTFGNDGSPNALTPQRSRVPGEHIPTRALTPCSTNPRNPRWRLKCLIWPLVVTDRENAESPGNIAIRVRTASDKIGTRS